MPTNGSEHASVCSITKKVLAVQAIAHMLVLGVILAGYDSGQLVDVLAMGLVFGQLGVAAVWMAWGAQRFSLRVWSATAMAAVVAAVLVLRGWHEAPAAGLVYGALCLGQWILVQVPLWIARTFWGWHLAKLNPGEASVFDDGLQFGLKHLLGWTLAIAVLLGLGRWLMPDEEVFGSLGAIAGQVVVPFCLLLTFSLLVSLTAIAGGLVGRKVWVWIPVSLVAAVAVSVAMHLVFLSRADMSDDIGLICTLNGLQWTWLLGSMIVLRWGGYRLRRFSRSANPQTG